MSKCEETSDCELAVRQVARAAPWQYEPTAGPSYGGPSYGGPSYGRPFVRRTFVSAAVPVEGTLL